MMNKVISVVADLKPDKVVLIGDAIDLPQVSQWSKGNSGEYAETLQRDIDGFRNGVLVPLRNAVDGEMIWVEGNHDLRIREFVKRYAFPLTTLRALEVPKLFELDELAVSYMNGPVRIATNTYAIHGHEAGGYAATASAWDLKYTKRYGSDKNFVFGHTHQPFLVTRGYGMNGKITPRWTMNVGSVMDPTHAHYVKDGAVPWTMSFAIIRDDGKRVYPELITAYDRGFYLNGRKY
jgi:predicted phosphodiesterase